MRLDRESLRGTWIFAITLFHPEGLIQIEDCIVASDVELRSSQPFSERFAHIQKFSENIWFSDQRFQLNWQLTITEFFPLISIKQALAGLNGGNLCLMPESPTFRLLKVTYIKPAEAPITNGPKDYVCVPIEGKPDVYDLAAPDTGAIIGRAAIQTLAISQGLQLRRSTGQPLRVMAEWSEDFDSYLVISLV